MHFPALSTDYYSKVDISSYLANFANTNSDSSFPKELFFTMIKEEGQYEDTFSLSFSANKEMIHTKIA